MTDSSRTAAHARRPAGFMQGLRAIAGDRRGVAAIEFAFIAPVLLCLYFMTMEVSQGIEVNKKIGRLGSTVADLVTQQQSITKTEIDAILKIGGAVLQPYGRSLPVIAVTAIQISDEATPKAKVVWSRKLTSGATAAGAAKDTITTVPAALNVRNTFLIRVESQLDYRPVVTYTADQKRSLGLTSAFDSIAMQDNYYLRPRMSTNIPCADC